MGPLDFGSLFQGLGWAGWLVPVLYVVGAATALDAVMKARTPQGATAWVFALATLPLVALPLYWIFGRVRFDDYLDALREFDQKHSDVLDPACEHAVSKRHAALAGVGDPGNDDDPGDDPPDARPEDSRLDGEMQAFSAMATLPFTHGNCARLLIDGQETFDALFEAMDRAERYLLVQFYIVHDDAAGQAFAERLIAAAARGVQVHFLFDGVGSWKLPRKYKRRLSDAGVCVCSFTGPRSWLKKLRLNFRNHRKIVVVDGAEAFVGGLNVGDEYMGRDEKIGPWRDTHLHVHGPTVQGLQQSFVRDWYYASRDELELQWEPTPHDADQTALVMASGPADQLETCGLLYTHAIESAEKRIWIATPYFVPDGRVLGALQLAALRGVDVRVIVPRKSDSLLFKWVPYAYLVEVEQAGVKLFAHEPGFMHQKVTLVDDDFATVGTANFDNRSFRLNFEATVVVKDEAFCQQVAAMLDDDLARSSRVTSEELESASWLFRFGAQATRLLAPVL